MERVILVITLIIYCIASSILIYGALYYGF